jgi:hypothetical protein
MMNLMICVRILFENLAFLTDKIIPYLYGPADSCPHNLSNVLRDTFKPLLRPMRQGSVYGLESGENFLGPFTVLDVGLTGMLPTTMRTGY